MFPSGDEIRNALRSTFAHATKDEIYEGIRWYPSQSLRVANWAIYNAKTFRLACNVWSICSINTSWNLINKAVDNAMKGWGLKYVTEKVRLTNLGYDVRDSFTPKFYNFAHNLEGHLCFVTLDRWMMRIIGREKLTAKQYDIYSVVLENEAMREGLHPAEYQAICWLVSKRINK
jgi:hypothetical protein